MIECSIPVRRWWVTTPVSLLLVKLLSADTTHKAAWCSVVIASNILCIFRVLPGQKWVLDFPHGRFGADGKLEILPLTAAQH
jgi:hypothetical protein